MRPRKKDYAPQLDDSKAPPCSVAGCVAPGGYKAPKSRESLEEYQWFCLEHVREHNAKWDYLAGMEQEEIEDFMRDAVTGHRPTWEREGRASDKHAKLNDALHNFMYFTSGKTKRQATLPPLNRKLRKALTLLELEYPYNESDLKSHYRAMVKRYHPDVNQGSKIDEERFKQITVSYSLLKEHLSSGNM